MHQPPGNRGALTALRGPLPLLGCAADRRRDGWRARLRRNKRAWNGVNKDPMASNDDERRLPRTTPQGRKAAALVVGTALAGMMGMWLLMIRMPGHSYQGPLPSLDEQERGHQSQLAADVAQLATVIGERHALKPQALAQAADFVDERFQQAGYVVSRQPFKYGRQHFDNIEIERKGTAHGSEIVVVGAHYDSAMGTSAANDNASGVAVLITLAQAFANTQPSRTLRFVAFSNEEPPHFQTAAMGSLVYAARCKERNENVVAMLSLETMGYFKDGPGTQNYPFPLNLFYSDTGNFIGFVGDLSSRSLVHEVVASFRSNTQFPSEGVALPSGVQGVGWSDHWSFWQHGYPAVMVTDTAIFRYPHYHTEQDTADQVDTARLARVVTGLVQVINDLTKVARR